ncbi:MAG: T9SS type A sorting domain-containing protein [Ignavibacteriales bacterium]|nr:T9SS type A sorting domain-containing protein [Ignavibacteriales bacterium]
MIIKKYISAIVLFTFLPLFNNFSQVLSDPLQGSTIGTQYGGSFTGEGYQPGIGNNHIHYNIPTQIVNGYIEFEVKGFNPAAVPVDEDHAFAIIYDSRGITEPINYFTGFKFNYFRWNFHWRQNRSAFKGVINCAAPTSENINSPVGYWTQVGDEDPRDWNSEPTGTGISWNQSIWYKIKIEWNNRQFTAYVDNEIVWSTSGPYDYAPQQMGIWIGSGPYKYDADVNVTYRNFKLYNLGGTTSDYLGISPPQQTVSSSSGSTNISVISNINWNISDNASWLTLSSNAGSNNGTINASFTQNTGTSNRVATITATGGGMTRTATITQSGLTSSNYLSVSADSLFSSFSADTVSFDITSNVSWSIVENEDWVSISPTSGSNNSTIGIIIEKNASSSIRQTVISVSGGGITRTIQLIQNGYNEFINIEPDSIFVNSSNGEAIFEISSNVNWTVETLANWLSFSTTSSSGNQSLKVFYSQNFSESKRQALVIVKNDTISQNITIIQEGSSIYLKVNPKTWPVSRSGGSVTFMVESNISWQIQNNINWITTSFIDSSGNASFIANFTTNTDTSSRKGKIMITGSGFTDSVTIDQSGSVPFEVTAISNPIQGGFVIGDGIYGQGSTVNLEAIAMEGWKFKNWIEDSTIISVDSVYSFILNTSRSFIANFDMVTMVNDFNEVPTEYTLYQNYPNPFNPKTIINFALPEANNVKITLYDMLGNNVEVITNAFYREGIHQITYSAEHLSSGIYLYTITAGDFKTTKKMILLK